MNGTLTPFGTRRPDLFGDFRREIDDLFGRMLSRDTSNGGTEWFAPLANVSESEDRFEVTLDLPGINPEDVSLELKHGELWITGERKRDEQTDEKKYHRVETYYGRFQRMIRLNTEVDADKVDAEYHDGVLRITVPKAEAAKPRRIAIRK